MEESPSSSCNAFIADCIVISCCCQCLVLQLLVFLLLELPRRIVRKTRQYAKRKLNQKRNKKKKMSKETCLDEAQEQDTKGGSIGLDVGGSKRMICELESLESNMGEIEKVLEELSMKGEFAFGSFWGRSDNKNFEKGGRMCVCCSKCVIRGMEDLEYGCHVVNFQFIQMVDQPG